jgi:predicted nucleic acid-binding protein
LLSGLFWKGAPRLILALAAEGCIEMIISEVVVEEATEVIAEKWPSKAGLLDDFLGSLPRVIHHQRPSIRAAAALSGSIRDPDDAPLLAAVMRVRRLDAFVTGDKDFFDPKTARQTKTVRPADFLHEHRHSLFRCAERANPNLAAMLGGK